jgi:diguanylate cyclase (GGDEF)-like protein
MKLFGSKDGKMTVAVVDDSRENILILNELLKDFCEVIVATSGREGVELIIAKTPDLVLLDIRMDDISGFEVCRRLKEDEHTQHIPVIFITALDDEEDEKYGLKIGAIDYIRKPFSSHIVRARVTNHLKLKEQSDILRNLSMLDGLTGLPNRRLMESFLASEWKRCGRNSTPLSIIMIDIDYFKPFNDKYGHLSGDECLKAVATALSDSIQRPGDIVARYGGEEFIAILPGTGMEGASHLAERMRHNVSALNIPHELSRVAKNVTTCVGVATAESCREGSPLDLTKAADEHLYIAKEGGRNRVVSKAG